MRNRIVVSVVVLLAASYLVLHLAGSGWFGRSEVAGSPKAPRRSESIVAERAAVSEAAARAVGVANPKQILFGDLHVHSTFSFDAFQMSLPMAQGDGSHPIADACDFARHCSALDFWSINDHGIALTPERWAQTVDSIRECNEVAGDPANPDTVAYLGWEWTQVGWVPEQHYGHKNVILRDLEDEKIPTRPITAGTPPGTPPTEEIAPASFLVGAMALSEWSSGGPELATYMTELFDNVPCEKGVPVRDLPDDCQEIAQTPDLLFEKLDDWGHAAMVIPHGTTWGMYTPLGSTWDKQLSPGMHDPKYQRVIEVFSGHGNSEEMRSFREVIFNADGSKMCPPPNDNYLPSCWRAGEIIEARCIQAGEAEAECDERTAEARQFYVDAYRNGGGNVVPGAQLEDWQDSGQCRDCFQPSFNYRPRSSVQYILALGREGAPEGQDRFRFGLMASSDNHSARPGTGYKEFSRREFTEARFGEFIDTPIGDVPFQDDLGPEPYAVEATRDFSTAIFSIFETERASSFFLNGGLTAVHSAGRSREQIWDAMNRREVYGTSGPRILLWFDLLNAPGGRPAPMGSVVETEEAPIFQVRALGSFEQKPGCPADAQAALGDSQVERICQGECYHPSDARRAITRIEVVRILPQTSASEEISGLVEDPWKVIPCPGDGGGCQVAFSDPEYDDLARDAVYYVRAIEAPSMAVAANPLSCEYDESGRCIDQRPCIQQPWDDDCLAETEERAWSSPIFVERTTQAEVAQLQR